MSGVPFVALPGHVVFLTDEKRQATYDGTQWQRSAYETLLLTTADVIPTGLPGQLLVLTDLEILLMWFGTTWHYVGGRAHVDSVYAPDTSLPASIPSGTETPLTSFETTTAFGDTSLVVMDGWGVIKLNTTLASAKVRIDMDLSITNPSNNFTSELVVQTSTAGGPWVTAAWGATLNGSRDDTHHISRFFDVVLPADTSLRLALTANQTVDLEDFDLRMEILSFEEVSASP